MNTLEDRNVTDKTHWDAALRFLEGSLQDKITINEANLREQVKCLLLSIEHSEEDLPRFIMILLSVFWRGITFRLWQDDKNLKNH